jgi:hypothetical protein
MGNPTLAQRVREGWGTLFGGAFSSAYQSRLGSVNSSRGL